MRKQLTAIMIFSFAFNASAQTLPNFDMETWIGNGFWEEPQEWVTSNSILNQPGDPSTVFKTTESHTGSYAVLIRTIFYSGPFSGGLYTGYIANGNINTPAYGTPFTSRPANVNFWYKLSSVDGDTSRFQVKLTKWNSLTGIRDVIALGVWESNTSISTFNQVTLPLTYLSNIVPDTIRVEAMSSAGIVPKPGTNFTIDDITFSGVTGIEVSENLAIQVFPNPTSGKLYIELPGIKETHIEIIDLSGKLMVHRVSTQYHEEFDLSKLPLGFYFYRISDGKGKLISAGKINVM